MESSTNIIAFNGLPGCGKTTLCNKLIEQYPDTIIDVDSVYQSYRQQKLSKRLLEIPFKVVVKLCWLIIISPKLYKKDWNIYIGCFVHVLAYNHFKQTKYKVLLSDNGTVQDIVSLFYKKESKFSNRHIKIFSSIINSYDNLHQVYCDIPVSLSLERIRTRNRHKGRLDLISDDNKLREDLATQHDFFIKMNEILANLKNDFQVINMNSEIEEIVSLIKNKYSFLQSNV